MGVAETMASADAAPKIAAFLYLEEVIALQRCSRQHARRFGAPGAALRSRVQPRSRAAHNTAVACYRWPLRAAIGIGSLAEHC